MALTTEEILSLLRSKQWGPLIQEADFNRRVIRVLLGRVLSSDLELHWMAVEALGKVAKFYADKKPEKVRELIRRLIWSLREEAGATPWGATEAIGAILSQDLNQFGDYLHMIVPFMDDENLCIGVLWSFVQAGRKDFQLIEEYQPQIVDCLSHPNAQIRGYGLWCVGQLRVPVPEKLLQILKKDFNQVYIYDREVMKLWSITDLAALCIVEDKTKRSG